MGILTRKNAMEKKIIMEMSVPILTSFTYFCAKTMTSGKYSKNGVRMLV